MLSAGTNFTIAILDIAYNNHDHSCIAEIFANFADFRHKNFFQSSTLSMK